MTNLPAILRPETGELKLPARPLRVLGIDLGTVGCGSPGRTFVRHPLFNCVTGSEILPWHQTRE